MPAPALPLPPPAHDAPLPPAVPGPRGTRLLAGVPYAAVPGWRPMELDLYLPADATGPVPVVVFLHGGGWRLGSRRTAGPAYPGAEPFGQLAAAGIAVASVDYRLSGEATWPAQLHDVKAAVRWLRARSAELGVDSDRIAAWGESAGGHLAALLGLTADVPALEGQVGLAGPSSAVAAVAAWYPPTDLARVAADAGGDPDAPDSREAQLLGAPVPTVPELAEQASPITHASPAAPPFLLLHGRADRFVPCPQSERLAAALESAGTAVQLHTYADADHMWLGDPAAAADALERTVSFLTDRFG
ncbi:alpha/beta hydrolase fold domain-containing protein [Modestobacter sp. SYSU DS0657]